MPKAKMIKYWLCAIMAFNLFASAWAQPQPQPQPQHTQPVLGQLIEQAKSNKLIEMTQPRLPNQPGAALGMPAAGGPASGLPGSAPARAKPVKQVKPEPELPALWSLSGVNTQLIAELWHKQTVHRIVASPGASLPGGWEIIEADPQSLTLQQGKLIKKLYPAAPGSTGGEFAAMKSSMGLDGKPLGMGLGNRNQSSSEPILITGPGIPNSALPFINSGNVDMNQPNVNPSIGLNSAREAAASLPAAPVAPK